MVLSVFFIPLGHQASPVRMPEPRGVRVRLAQEEEAGPATATFYLGATGHLWQQSVGYAEPRKNVASNEHHSLRSIFDHSTLLTKNWI